jgi:hypothetical protein
MSVYCLSEGDTCERGYYAERSSSREFTERFSLRSFHAVDLTLRGCRTTTLCVTVSQ